MSGQSCAGLTGDRWSRSCPRPATVEVDGRMYCGPHAAGAKRSIAARAKADERHRAKQERRERMESLAEELSVKLGTSIKAYYPSFEAGYSERLLLVPVEWLTELAAVHTTAGHPPSPDSDSASPGSPGLSTCGGERDA